MGYCSKFTKEVDYRDPPCDYAKKNLPCRYPNRKDKHPTSCQTCPVFLREREQVTSLKRGFFNSFLLIEG